jgi:hypothetical protein
MTDKPGFNTFVKSRQDTMKIAMNCRLHCHADIRSTSRMDGKRGFVLYLSLILFLSASFSIAQNPADSTNVLFIGNSITYYNNMPQMFGNIAISKGKNVAVTTYAPGGSGIVDHYVDPNVYSLFRNFDWDIIVIQPGSGESAGVTWPVDTTIARGKILLDSIYHYHPCARVYLYEIPYGVPSASTYSTYFSVQTIIRDSVTRMADSLRLQIIPAGECVRAYYSMHQNLLLHNAYNDIHPSACGSFLVASAFYAGIFQEAVSGCTYCSSIDPDTAFKFFSITDTVVLDHLPTWRINTYNLHAGFHFSINGNNIVFTSLSSNYTFLLWGFGDNTFSSQTNPVHPYLANGVYTIKLYAYAATCVDSLSRMINLTINTVHKLTEASNAVSIFPDPVQSILNIRTLHTLLEIGMYNVLGQNLVFTAAVMGTEYTVNMEPYENGLYYLTMKFQSGERISRKIIKVSRGEP